MSLKTPRWWYAQPGSHRPFAHTLLKPLSLIWASATASRLRRGKPVDPGAPVICIGNLTVGGTGKTPVSREIVLRLRRAGVEAQLLSRGYGGRLKGPTRVDGTVHTAADVGDEPLMLARDFPVWVSRDRPAGAEAAVAAGAQAIVMDDGHQNPSLKKALSFVVVDGETRGGEWPFGDGSVVPAGPMREPLAKGLARADAVILLLPAEMKEADPKLLALFVAKPVLVARLVAASQPPRGPVVAFAGVGKPWKVERGLKDAGVDLVEFVPFPDHGTYDEKTLQDLAIRARLAKASLVTTEKDWVRLPAPWRERIRPWPVRARFEDERRLDAMLLMAIGG
jgi:tetraacyldisaccharide 4'-kinase